MEFRGELWSRFSCMIFRDTYVIRRGSHTHVTDTHTHAHTKIYVFKFKFSWWLIVIHGRCCYFSVFSFVGVGLSILEVCDLLWDNGLYS